MIATRWCHHALAQLSALCVQSHYLVCGPPGPAIHSSCCTTSMTGRPSAAWQPRKSPAQGQSVSNIRLGDARALLELDDLLVIHQPDDRFVVQRLALVANGVKNPEQLRLDIQ